VNRWELGTLDLKPRLPEILSSNDDGMRTWTAWAILAYDLDTLAIRSRRKLRHAHSTRATHKPDSAAPQPRRGRFSPNRLSGASSYEHHGHYKDPSDWLIHGVAPSRPLSSTLRRGRCRKRVQPEYSVRAATSRRSE
jgi:hypothetical protein